MKRIILFTAMFLFIAAFIFIRVLSSFPLEERFAKTGAITGRATNDQGQPVQGATIRIVGTTKGALTKADGSFRIAGITPGSYQIKGTAVGYSEFVTNIEVTDKAPANISVIFLTRPIDRNGGMVTSLPLKPKPERSATSAGTVRMTTSEELERSARTNIQEAVALSSGTTSGGVNGFSIRGGRATETSIRLTNIEITDPFLNSGRSIADRVPVVRPGHLDPILPAPSDNPAPAKPAPAPPKPTPAPPKPAPAPTPAPEAEPDSVTPSIGENEFIPTMRERTSTFGIDVDNASYSMVRQQVSEGTLPNPAAVRIEEMINYFDYDYPEPIGEDPFSIITEVSSCPWNPEHRLVHIGLQGRHVDISEVPPSNLVFLIDVSGSMASPEKLPLLVNGFKLMVNQLRPQDNVAIVVYAGAAGLVLPSTPGTQKEKIIAALDKLSAGGSTAGGEGIQLAYDIAKKSFRRDGNNRVILATDGDFNVGISSDDALVKLIEAKRKEKIFLTVLGFGMRYAGDRKMEKLADNGNGSYAYIDNLPEAQRVLVNELSGTLYTIAKDVKIQVEFNPVTVAGYRLIGYENRMLANEDFANDLKDAGDLGAGHSVTALYEVIPNDRTKEEMPHLSDARPADASMRYGLRSINTEPYMTSELLDIRLRYKLPQDSASKLVEHPLTDRIADIATASENFRFAAAVAELGLLLRNSRYKGSATYDAMLALARGAMGADKDGYRRELVEIGEKCGKMRGEGRSEK